MDESETLLNSLLKENGYSDDMIHAEQNQEDPEPETHRSASSNAEDGDYDPYEQPQSVQPAFVVRSTRHGYAGEVWTYDPQTEQRSKVDVGVFPDFPTTLAAIKHGNPKAQNGHYFYVNGAGEYVTIDRDGQEL